MIDLWAATGPKRILITTPNAGKVGYDEALVHNPEHIWEPTEQLIEDLTPAGYECAVSKSSEADFFLIELNKVPVAVTTGTTEQRISELAAENDNLRRLAEEREIYAASLTGNQRALENQVQQLDEQVTRVLPAKIDNLEKDLTKTRAAKQQVERDLNEVLQSRSWKLTKPLRSASRRTASLMGRNKNEPVEEPPEARAFAEPDVYPEGTGVCTVISKNYLAQARVLVASFKEHHPDIPFYVLLADKLDGYFDPRKEQFELLELDQLDIPDPDRFRFHYNVLEHDTAVKPYFFSCLLRNYGLKKLVYLDPDIQVLDRLDNLFSLLDEHS
jgi:hypothetical protein